MFLFGNIFFSSDSEDSLKEEVFIIKFDKLFFLGIIWWKKIVFYKGVF